MNFKQALKEKWYSQNFNASPIHLFSAANCGFLMDKRLGVDYKFFLYVFKKDYGAMCYYQDDLTKLGDYFEEMHRKDKDFFRKIRKIYDKDFKVAQIFLSKTSKIDLDKKSDSELFDLAKISAYNIGAAVGVAHLIEPFVLNVEVKIKEALSKKIKDSKEINTTFSILLSPVDKSFIKEYENGLWKIKKEKDKTKRLKLIEKQISRFYWIKNTYAGRRLLTKADVLKDMSALNKNENIDIKSLRKQKSDIIKSVELDKDTVNKIDAIEFITKWQDDRKANILICIDYLDRVLAEIARRYKLELQHLRYATEDELDDEHLSSRAFKNELYHRWVSSCYIYSKDKIEIISGKEADAFAKIFYDQKEHDVKQINGITASSGTAVGPVRVCTNLKSISEFKEGEILVASMTRPEYIPAMKKARAIITDEGGITCHAAIVARELGIPCVIGTKIASKALHDGDLVEVKANHGLIIIMKRK